MERCTGAWELNLTGVYWLFLEVTHTSKASPNCCCLWCWKPWELVQSGGYCISASQLRRGCLGAHLLSSPKTRRGLGTLCLHTDPPTPNSCCFQNPGDMHIQPQTGTSACLAGNGQQHWLLSACEIAVQRRIWISLVLWRRRHQSWRDHRLPYHVGVGRAASSW